MSDFQAVLDRNYQGHNGPTLIESGVGVLGYITERLLTTNERVALRATGTVGEESIKSMATVVVEANIHNARKHKFVTSAKQVVALLTGASEQHCKLAELGPWTIVDDNGELIPLTTCIGAVEHPVLKANKAHLVTKLSTLINAAQ